MALENLQCKNCGNNLDITKAQNGIIKCDHCGSIFTLPKNNLSDDAKINLINAQNLLDSAKFSDARAFFEKVKNINNEEPEAYFGMALADAQVRYLKDEVNNRLQPICYSTDDKKIKDDENYKKALKYASEEQKKVYEERATEIDAIHAEFNFLRKKDQEEGLNGYDCFICTKITDYDGKKTEESRVAEEIYNILSNDKNRIRTFYSEKEVKGRTGYDYEALILYALYTAQTMIIVCFDENYLKRTEKNKWVYNEYSRFLNLINDEDKDKDSITIVFKDYQHVIQKLEGKHGKIQGVPYCDENFEKIITDYVDNHTPRHKKKVEEEKLRKENERIDNKKERDKEIEESKKLIQDLRDTITNIRKNNANNSVNYNKVSTCLIRAKQELEENNRSGAEKYYKEIIDNYDPYNYTAWWGLFLIEFKVSNEQELLDRLSTSYMNNILKSKNYRYALKYAEHVDENSAKAIVNFNKTMQSNYIWWNHFLKEYEAETYSDFLNEIEVFKEDVKFFENVCDNENLNNAMNFRNSNVGDTAKEILMVKDKIEEISDDNSSAIRNTKLEILNNKTELDKLKESLSKDKKELLPINQKILIYEKEIDEINDSYYGYINKEYHVSKSGIVNGVIDSILLCCFLCFGLVVYFNPINILISPLKLFLVIFSGILTLCFMLGILLCFRYYAHEKKVKVEYESKRLKDIETITECENELKELHVHANELEQNIQYEKNSIDRLNNYINVKTSELSKLSELKDVYNEVLLIFTKNA